MPGGGELLAVYSAWCGIYIPNTRESMIKHLEENFEISKHVKVHDFL